MNILWAANIPYLNPSESAKVFQHRAPWILELASSLVECKEIENLIIVSFQRYLNGNSKIEKITLGKVTFVYLKVHTGYFDLFTFSILKTRIFNTFLKKIDINIDLIHIHGTENQFLSIFKKCKYPIIFSIQGIINEIYRFVGNKCTSFVGWYWIIAKFYEKKYIGSYQNFSCRTHWDNSFVSINNPNAKIFNIWEVIREDFFHFNTSFSNNSGVLFVGGTQIMKGIREVLRTINYLQNALFFKGDFYLGGNITMASINQIIVKEDLKINFDKVFILGGLDTKDMVNYYKKCFCLLHPSYIDNSPNSICEAQIAGLPVIATNVGGVSSLIEDYKTGIFCTLDYIDISTKLLKLYKDKNLQDFISNSSKIVSRRRHDKKNIVKQTLDMYKTVMQNV